MTDLWTAARERILILDGAGGTQLQRAPLTEADFRLPGGLPSDLLGADPSRTCRGNLDLLQLTRPDVVRAVHRAYFGAGADIASTNTFNSTAISQARYGTGALAYRMNLEGARLAREVADEWLQRHPGDATVMAYIGRSGWNDLSLTGAIPPEELLEALTGSYRLVVAGLPKKFRPAGWETVHADELDERN